MVSNRSWYPRFNTVPRSNWKCKDWYRARFNGFRKIFGYLSGNSGYVPPDWKSEDKNKDGYKSKPPRVISSLPPSQSSPLPSSNHPTTTADPATAPPPSTSPRRTAITPSLPLLPPTPPFRPYPVANPTSPPHPNAGHHHPNATLLLALPFFSSSPSPSFTSSLLRLHRGRTRPAATT
nr:proline-rich receptor-like protein kinase PERK1 [Arachis hypogaea]